MNITASIETGNSITVYVDFVPYSITSDRAEFGKVLAAVDSNDAKEVVNLINKAKAVSNFSKGNLEVKHGQVYYKGEALHSVIVDKVLSLIDEDRPYIYLMNFLEKLLQNPSKRAVEELYTFLQHKYLPITADGCFLGYKAVTKDYKDKYSRKFDYSIGSVASEDRNKVDDNKDKGCSHGLHVGSLEYAKSFARGNDKIVIVKVNPANVVCIPSDCNFQKLRACEITIVSDYKAPLEESVYDEGGKSFQEQVDSGVDDDRQLVEDTFLKIAGDYGQYANSVISIREIWKEMGKFVRYEVICDVLEQNMDKYADMGINYVLYDGGAGLGDVQVMFNP